MLSGAARSFSLRPQSGALTSDPSDRTSPDAGPYITSLSPTDLPSDHDCTFSAMSYPSDSKTGPDAHLYQPDPDSKPNAYPPEPKILTDNEHEATTSASPTFPEPIKAHVDDYDTSNRLSTDFRVSLDEPVADNLPEADHPTIALLIPFPTLLRPPSKKDAKVPPFLMYAPLAAPLPPPKEGEKQSLKDKAIRKWQKEETDARGKKTGFKAKAVGVRDIPHCLPACVDLCDVAHLEGYVCDEKLADRVPSADTK